MKIEQADSWYTLAHTKFRAEILLQFPFGLFSYFTVLLQVQSERVRQR